MSLVEARNQELSDLGRALLCIESAPNKQANHVFKCVKCGHSVTRAFKTVSNGGDSCKNASCENSEYNRRKAANAHRVKPLALPPTLVCLERNELTKNSKWKCLECSTEFLRTVSSIDRSIAAGTIDKYCTNHLCSHFSNRFVDTEYVKGLFHARGVVPLDFTYQNDPDQRLPFICKCGTHSDTNYRFFLKPQQYPPTCSSCKDSHRPRGERNFKFNPNLTEQDRIAHSRNFTEKKHWIKAIRARDGACVISGKQEDLQAHHIFNFNDFPDLRWNQANGVVLHKDVHVEFHRIHGYGNNTLDQFKEFYLSKTGLPYINHQLEALLKESHEPAKNCL